MNYSEQNKIRQKIENTIHEGSVWISAVPVTTSFKVWLNQLNENIFFKILIKSQVYATQELESI